MGSIGAVLFRQPALDRPRVERMLAAAPHRGSKRSLTTLGSCALGISTDDLFDDADLASDDGLAAAVTGSLDNLSDLIDELTRRGSPPATPSPAHVILAAWRAYGAAAPARLRGVFAAVVSDGSALWCWRDHLGFKTLFCREEPQTVYIGTEAKQVLAGAGLSRRPNLEVVESIFYNELQDQSRCALEGVERIPKATVFSVDRTRSSQVRYWQPEVVLETGRYTSEEIKAKFDELMEQAVRRTLTGRDVVSLSGGVDSPPIAVFGAGEHLAMSGRSLAALSVVYPNQPSVDESDYIRVVADHLGIPLHTYERSARPLDDIDRWVHVLDGPVPKILTCDADEHYRKARSLGFLTMLTGEVAEFVFDRRGDVLPHLLFKGHLRGAARYVAALRNGRQPWVAIAKEIGSTFVPRSLSIAYRRARLPYGTAPVPDFLEVDRFKRKYVSSALPRRKRWVQEQLWAFDGPGLTMEADDIVQALCGIRTRRPWADVDLWEFFLSLPAEQKVETPGSKQLVRGLLRGKVPDVILDRSDKTGFDESITARIDYHELKRRLTNPIFLMPGVSHHTLLDRLERRNLNAHDYMWAKDLAAVYAFVEDGQ